MYRLTVFDYFSSAHQLKGYRGRCESVHGHNWKVEAEVEGNTLDDIGLLIDFKELRSILKDVIDRLDHVLLNDLVEFKNCNPSSELIARNIYAQMKDRLPHGVRLVTVTVWESDNAKAIYFE
jgi:6-pyruvoyltetrahydropterin/6-carboxytetrahydropterin synthase